MIFLGKKNQRIENSIFIFVNETIMHWFMKNVYDFLIKIL